MPSRRAHTKSRLGCVQCKARRVKCDQTYPTCNNCVRHEKTCVYAPVKTGGSSNASRTTNGDSPGVPAAPLATQLGGPVFDSLDMILMHHFCTSTATSLSSSTHAQDVWRNDVPKQAREHPMLMHGVLTLAANHYVHINKSSSGASEPLNLHEYRTRALHHQQLGLQIFRHQVQNPAEDEAHDILMTFAAVLGMLTFADAESEQQTLTFEDALNLLAVLRGKQALWRAGRGLTEKSDFAAAFFDPPPPGYRADFSKTILSLNRLQEAVEDDVRKVSIAVLKGVAENQGNSEYRLLGTWPAGLSDEFLHLLKLKDSIALQTFDHYCTILDSLRHLWWVGGFGERLRAAIRGVQSSPRVEPEYEPHAAQQDEDIKMAVDSSH